MENHAADYTTDTDLPSPLARYVKCRPNTLFSDAIHIIYSYLCDETWKYSCVWRVCKQWYSAAGQQTWTRDRTLSIEATANNLMDAVHSRVRHHITELSINTRLRDSTPRRLIEQACSLQFAVIRKLTIYYHARKDSDGAPQELVANLTPLTTLRELRMLKIVGLRLSPAQLKTINQIKSLQEFCWMDAEKRTHMWTLAQTGFMMPFTRLDPDSSTVHFYNDRRNDIQAVATPHRMPMVKIRS